MNFFRTSSASNATACHCLVMVAVTKGKCLPSCHRTTQALSRDKEMVKVGGKGMGGEFSVGVDVWKKPKTSLSFHYHLCDRISPQVFIDAS